MYPYRVFVSYSRSDERRAARVRAYLSALGARPMSDVDLPAGQPFTEEIKSKIAHAHVFMPLLTTHSGERPWVHQEIGYAMGLGVPILPLALGALPEGLAEQLHAVTLSPDLENLGDRLRAADLQALVSRAQETSCAAFQSAEELHERTRLLVSYARSARRLGGAGRVRQRLAFSSFSLPNKRITHPDWDKREGIHKRSPEVRELLRQEREVMEEHAREAGCDLILDPSVSADRHGPEATAVRLRILVDFLKSIPDDKVVVVTQRGEIQGSLIMIDDWFVAEAVVPHYGLNYTQTIFTRHAATCLSKMQKFDRLLKELLSDSGLRPEHSRVAAIETLEEMMEGLGRS